MSDSGKKSGNPVGDRHDTEKDYKTPSQPARIGDREVKPLESSGLPPPTELPDTARSIGGWMIVMLWIMGLAMATYLAQTWMDNRAASREGTLISDEKGQQALLLRSNRYGQYWVRGSVNDEKVLFLIDTGASGISIPDSVARTLGLRRGRAFDVNTANGVITVYATQLESLSVGPLSRNNVPAHINPGMQGDMALLGMSFLHDFEIVHRDGEMIIRNP